MSEKLLSKKEAADFLGISERTLQNLLSQKKIGHQLEKVKTGHKIVFQFGELERYKRDRDAERAQIEAKQFPAVQHLSQDEDLQRVENRRDAGVQALAMLPDSNQMEVLGRLFETMLQRQPQQEERLDSTLLAAKLVLTLNECRALTSFSQATLKAAISDGKLKAQKIGRGWKVKRSDLDKYVENL